MNYAIVVLGLVATACGRIGFAEYDDPANAPDGGLAPDLDTTIDATGSVTSSPCSTPFDAPARVVELATSVAENGPWIADDARTLYWHTTSASGVGADDIWFATRADRASPFGPAQLVANINSTSNDGGAALSSDGLDLYFSSERPGGAGSGDLWIAHRDAPGVPFNPPQRLATVNSPQEERSPAISADGLTLYFASDRGGRSEIWAARRTAKNLAFASPTLVAELVSSDSQTSPAITANGLAIVFERGTFPTRDLWVATRPEPTGAFASPTLLAEVDTSFDEHGPSIASSGELLAFTSNRGGQADLWLAERTCP